VKDFETAEKIYRKILTIDRNREDVVSRMNQLLSKKRRHRQNVRNLIIGGVIVAAASVGAWFAIDWYKVRRDTEMQRDLESQSRLEAIRTQAGNVQGDIALLLRELANRPSDLVPWRSRWWSAPPRAGRRVARADAVVASLAELRSQFAGTPAEAEAVDLMNQVGANAQTLKRKVADTQKTLRENAEGHLDQAHTMMRDVAPTRDVLAKLELAWKIAEDCPGWPASEKGLECQTFRTQVKECLAKFETTRAVVANKLADNDVNGAYDAAIAYITDHPDYRRRTCATRCSCPSASPRRRRARGCRPRGSRHGPGHRSSCVVQVCVSKGGQFDLDMPGFTKSSLDIPAVRDVDPAVVTEKLKRAYNVLLDKALAFRKGTSDGKPVTAAPLASQKYAVMPRRGRATSSTSPSGRSSRRSP